MRHPVSEGVDAVLVMAENRLGAAPPSSAAQVCTPVRGRLPQTNANQTPRRSSGGKHGGVAKGVVTPKTAHGMKQHGSGQRFVVLSASAITTLLHSTGMQGTSQVLRLSTALKFWFPLKCIGLKY
jgi:hypothetical protein